MAHPELKQTFRGHDQTPRGNIIVIGEHPNVDTLTINHGYSLLEFREVNPKVVVGKSATVTVFEPKK
ncbi:hypothetical protein C4559_04690 [Candidatus Microgenomates bacterium]|nr:MAG: hypothetical protein C4559_04690 [Candidatus Microgenomates bacterium]